MVLGEQPISAYVLCVTEIGKERDVLAKCLAVEGVVEGKMIYGEYDIVIKAVANNMRALSKIVESIRRIDGILRTVTLIEMFS